MMKVAFFSNFLNHHQLPFCEAMSRLTKRQFTFVATTPVPQERLSMGYDDMNEQYPFVLTTYDSEEKIKAAMMLALDSDVIITGSAPEFYTQERIKKNKLTFRYSERIYKNGLIRALSPRTIASQLIHHTRYVNKPLYMLCASAYTAFDFSLSMAYLGKTYKWGYFPETKTQNLDELFAHKQAKKTVSILWVGRLIGWKHPDVSILLAQKLKVDGYNFTLDIIGNGQMETELHGMIVQKELGDCVRMLGSMPPEDVRKHMEAADIFLFTSDFHEGWGAVLNESMNSGCAVVANHAIGSVPFLIRGGENGLIYKNGDINDLYEKVKILLASCTERERLGRNAYKTLAEIWNANVAAERFIQLVEDLLADGKSAGFSAGPCSPAKKITNWWYRG